MRRALQWVVVVLSLLPLAVGMLGSLTGVEFYVHARAANPNLDSQFRFMSDWDVAVMAVTVIELLIPALIPWQARVARQRGHSDHG